MAQNIVGYRQIKTEFAGVFGNKVGYFQFYDDIRPQFEVIVNLSMGVATHARLQNWTCSFQNIRLLTNQVFVIHTPLVNPIVAVTM